MHLRFCKLLASFNPLSYTSFTLNGDTKRIISYVLPQAVKRHCLKKNVANFILLPLQNNVIFLDRKDQSAIN